MTFQRTPSAVIGGTECFEPGSSPGASVLVPTWGASAPTAAPRAKADTSAQEGQAAADAAQAARAEALADDWIADGFEQTGEPSSNDAAPSWVAVAAGSGTATLERAQALDLTATTTAALRFDSWLSGSTSRAEVQVSGDGVTWETVAVAGGSDSWTPVEVSLDAYIGLTVRLRFVFTAESASADAWRIGAIGLTE